MLLSETIKRGETMNLKERRIALNMTQAEFAEKAGIDRGYYALVESGKRKPSFNVAKAIAGVHGIDIDPENLFGKDGIDANDQSNVQD